MKNETIGTIIKKIRKDNNLSQQQLSEILGLNNSTISKWEHDLIVPDISYLMIISDKFNIPLDKLISGELKPQKKPKKGLIMCMIILIETIKRQTGRPPQATVRAGGRDHRHLGIHRRRVAKVRGQALRPQA